MTPDQPAGPPWIGGDHDTDRPGYDTDHHGPREGREADEREAEIVRQWMRPGSDVPEGRCPATECWYTLPLNAQGLVVQHSQSGTLSTCEGGGRPPRAVAATNPSAGQDTERLRDELAAALDNTATGLFMGQSGPGWGDTVARILLGVPALARLIRERDEACATAQRVRDAIDATDHRGRALPGTLLLARLRRALDGDV